MHKKPLLFGILVALFLLVLAGFIEYVASLRDWFAGENTVRSILLGFARLPPHYLILGGFIGGFLAAIV